MKRKQGFTLIELMIVVAIIAIIAAIAIPSLLQARISGNEASAISSLRTITTVNEQYRTRFGRYPATLGELDGQDYIDTVLGAGAKSGYNFTLNGGGNVWTAFGVPQTVGSDGERGFFADESGVIRFTADGTQPDATSSPID